MLQWHLFKNGLIIPQVVNKSAMDCVLEGLRLISSSLLRKHDETIESLKLVTEQSAEDDDNSKSTIPSLTKNLSS